MTETQETKRTVGGTIAVDAYCLIDGFLLREDDDADGNPNDYKRVTVPITRLPAILGRDREANDDKNFFGIGTLKQFSREHFRIDYWCNERGRLGQHKSSDAFQWDHSQDSSDLMNPDDVDLSKPFFTVTCLGKNGLCVQGQKVEKDKSIVVKHGAAVQASALCFYFLQTLSPSYRKIKTTSDHKIIDSDSVDSPPSKRRRGLTGMQADLDLLSTEELLKQLDTAIKTNVWERKHQFIGSTLSGRAVMAAAQAPELHEKAAQSGDSLERSEVMDWIAESEQFSKWSQQMLTKLEAKSYQSSITNAMVKAGFTRTAEKGRYIKWILPKLGHSEGSSKKEGSKEAKQHTTPTKTAVSKDSGRSEKSVEAKGETKTLRDPKVMTAANKDETLVNSSREETAEQVGSSSGEEKEEQVGSSGGGGSIEQADDSGGEEKEDGDDSLSGPELEQK